MSGGFFRGTSADQDTRFSNKQAKLLKSQKFAPELDHLVDTTKVKMDVIRPWIATRATELLGFEDEVLINFVYGLLDGKEVDGKQIQIQLTGFMEKNTGKFMKELWSLLLSAQNNVSGVPQQFLDAKEEETRKKKVETDRIAQEIQKRRDRDGREPQRERKSRFDGEADVLKFSTVASDPKFSKLRASSVPPEEDREEEAMHSSRAKDGRFGSPPAKNRSPSPRIVPSPTRSNKSISRSRSPSQERHKSRSVSVSSQSPGRSISPKHRYQSPERQSPSPKRRYRSPPRRNISPRRGYSPRDTRSPLRHRSPRRRQRSHSRHRSPSPLRYRSPLARRRSPSPLRRRSPSPLRRMSPSPMRRRSPSPFRRRSPPPRRRFASPLHRRSPSPSRRRSPSPSRRRSPIKARRRSPSPLRRRSPIRRRLSPGKRKSPSPLRRRSPQSRSPNHRRRTPLHLPRSHPADSPPHRKRSRSPYWSRSPAHQTCRSRSRELDSHVNGSESRQYRDKKISGRNDVKNSPANHAMERELGERAGSKHKVQASESRNVPVSLRSPQCDVRNQSGDRKKLPSVSPENSPSHSESPSDMRKINLRTRKRSHSFSKSPVRPKSTWRSRHDSPGTSKEEEPVARAREVSHHRTDSSGRRSKDSPRDMKPESYVRNRREFSLSPDVSGYPLPPELKKRDGKRGSDVGLPEKSAEPLPNSSEIEYAPGRIRDESGSRDHIHNRHQSAKLPKRDVSFDRREHNEKAGNDDRRHRKGGGEHGELYHETDSVKSKKKMDNMENQIRLDSRYSDPEETNSYGNDMMDKRRYKKSDKRKRDYDDTSESDSRLDDKKEAKRRRKDEKRLRKEERRRRREERHRRKLERRAGKLKMKSIDTVSPPSKDNSDVDESDGGAAVRKNSHPCDADETESEQKRLEIELREKALESLRAKKAISH